jgi:hypothetical protein
VTDVIRCSAIGTTDWHRSLRIVVIVSPSMRRWRKHGGPRQAARTRRTLDSGPRWKDVLRQSFRCYPRRHCRPASLNSNFPLSSKFHRPSVLTPANLVRRSSEDLRLGAPTRADIVQLGGSLAGKLSSKLSSMMLLSMDCWAIRSPASASPCCRLGCPLPGLSLPAGSTWARPTNSVMTFPRLAPLTVADLPTLTGLTASFFRCREQVSHAG